MGDGEQTPAEAPAPYPSKMPDEPIVMPEPYAEIVEAARTGAKPVLVERPEPDPLPSGGKAGSG